MRILNRFKLTPKTWIVKTMIDGSVPLLRNCIIGIALFATTIEYSIKASIFNNIFQDEFLDKITNIAIRVEYLFIDFMIIYVMFFTLSYITNKLDKHGLL